MINDQGMFTKANFQRQMNCNVSKIIL